jgi:hypothetical protein
MLMARIQGQYERHTAEIAVIKDRARGGRWRGGPCRRVRAETLVVAGRSARCPSEPGRRGIRWEWTFPAAAQNPRCSNGVF